MPRINTLVTVALSVVLIAVSGYGFYRSYSAYHVSAYNCIAGPDEQCPSDAWYAEWKRWKALNAEVVKEQSSDSQVALQAKSDQLTGMTQRLAKAIPQGLQWDDKKQVFVKAPTIPPLETSPAQSMRPSSVSPIAGNAAKK